MGEAHPRCAGWVLITWAISATYAILLMAPATHACGCESSSLPCLGLCCAALNGFLNLFGETTVSQPAPETEKKKLLKTYSDW